MQWVQIISAQGGQNAKYSERADDFRLTPRTDITKRERYVRKVPRPDSCTATISLFDHLVGAGEKGRRDFDPKRFCSFEIDHHLEFCRLLWRRGSRAYLHPLLERNRGARACVADPFVRAKGYERPRYVHRTQRGASGRSYLPREKWPRDGPVSITCRATTGALPTSASGSFATGSSR